MQDFQACLSFALSIYVWVHSEICSVHKPDADTHLIKCGTPADSYPTAWGSYMEEEKPLGKQKRGGSANGKESSKNNKIKQLSFLASVPQLALKCPSLAACCQCSTAMTGQLMLTLSPSTTVTAWAAGSRSLAPHVPLWMRKDSSECVHVHNSVDCWDTLH